jgi:hypothetical protein
MTRRQAVACLERYKLTRLADAVKEAVAPRRLAMEQEVYFNLGRAFHHLSLTHAAIHHYRCEPWVQKFPPADDGTDKLLTPFVSLRTALDLVDAHPDEFEALPPSAHVTLETAHNLAAIYRATNATPLVAELLRRYLTID